MADGEIIIVLVYVDDLFLVASSLAAIYKIKDALHKRFEMEDLGEAKVILGLEIRRENALGSLKLSQGKYAAQVLEKFGMAECNPIGMPLEVGLQLVKANESDDALPYREAVGSLMYLLVGTRPDLAFAIGKLSRFFLVLRQGALGGDQARSTVCQGFNGQGAGLRQELFLFSTRL